MSPRPKPLPMKALDAWTDEVLRVAYRGESATDVLHQALLLKATADGHLDTRGQLRGERAARRQG